MRCAAELLDVAPELNRALAEQSLPPVRYGIGLHSGDVIAAHVGSRVRRQYAVIGDTVNVGSRFCGIAAADEVAFSSEVMAACETELAVRTTSTVTLKGIDEPVIAYVLLRPSTSG